MRVVCHRLCVPRRGWLSGQRQRRGAALHCSSAEHELAAGAISSSEQLHGGEHYGTSAGQLHAASYALAVLFAHSCANALAVVVALARTLGVANTIANHCAASAYGFAEHAAAHAGSQCSAQSITFDCAQCVAKSNANGDANDGALCVADARAKRLANSRHAGAYRRANEYATRHYAANAAARQRLWMHGKLGWLVLRAALAWHVLFDSRRSRHNGAGVLHCDLPSGAALLWKLICAWLCRHCRVAWRVQFLLFACSNRRAVGVAHALTNTLANAQSDAIANGANDIAHASTNGFAVDLACVPRSGSMHGFERRLVQRVRSRWRLPGWQCA